MGEYPATAIEVRKVKNGWVVQDSFTHRECIFKTYSEMEAYLREEFKEKN